MGVREHLRMKAALAAQAGTPQDGTTSVPSASKTVTALNDQVTIATAPTTSAEPPRGPLVISSPGSEVEVLEGLVEGRTPQAVL